MAALFAMLPACAASTVEPDGSPDPVVIERTVIERVCPPELTAPLGARPAVPDGAELAGNDPALAWLNAIMARLGLIEDRLTDAAAQCPAEVKP